MTTPNKKPARTLGGIFLFFGSLMFASGAWDVSVGKPAFLVAVAIGFLVTGILLILTLKLALIAYAITCVDAVIAYVSARSAGAEAAHDLTGALTILAVVAFNIYRQRFRENLR